MPHLKVNLRAKARGRGEVLLPWEHLGIRQDEWRAKPEEERQRLLVKIRKEV
jgi:hypothetical protein